MQTIEKALHQPMPFTTGGQTITDRLTAARHALAGSQLGKTICKATTEEIVAPKKKHLDYLLHCTNEPNVSIPSMANMLIERTQNTNWVVVYKALITIHNVMCYGNERFSQYLASCNANFDLTNFLDKANTNGYDMSTHVQRYAKYISEKVYSYRTCAFDFCKVKRGRDDGLLRTMHTDKLIKTLPILQRQVDALLEFQIKSSELNNGVVNCSFILMFRDLIRLFACYNDGVINLLEKFFDMNKKQAREAFDLYKSFLLRLDKVAAFLSVAESVGIDRGEIPDLTRAPASLLEALEAHLYHLEGGKGPPPSSSQQFVTQQLQQNAQPTSNLSGMSSGIDSDARQKYIEEEKERLRQYEEQRQRQLQTGGNFNPFEVPSRPPAPSPAAVASAATSGPPQASGGDGSLLFSAPVPQQQQQQQPGGIPHSDVLELYRQPHVDTNNPFAPFIPAGGPPPPVATPQFYGGYPHGQGGYPQQQQPFGFTGSSPAFQPFPNTNSSNYGSKAFDPFANASAGIQHPPKSDIDSTLSNLVNNMEIAGKNPAWMSHQQPPAAPGAVPGAWPPAGAAVNNPFAAPPPPAAASAAASSSANNPFGAPAKDPFSFQ